MKIALIVLMILMLAMAAFLVVAVLMQKSKKGLSGTIAGGNNDSFFDKSGATKTEKLMTKLTIIITIVFVLAVVAIHVIQPDYALNTFSNTSIWQNYVKYKIF